MTQPHYCGMIKGAPWRISVRDVSGAVVVKSGDTYAVSSGWALFGCAYAKMRAAKLTHVLRTDLHRVGFPLYHLRCHGAFPTNVALASGSLGIFGWCGRNWHQYHDASEVDFFWSPAGDPLQ